MSSPFTEDDDAIGSRVDWALWRRLLVHAYPYRLELGGMALTGLTLAAAETVLPLMTAKLIDGARAGRPLSELAWFGVGYCASLLVIVATIFAFIWIAGRISTGVGHDLRRAGFAQLQDLSFSFYDTRPIGWLVARITSDIGKVAGLLPWLMLDLVWGVSFMIGIVGAMLWLDPGLTLVVLVIVPPLVAVSLYFQRLLLESSREVRRTNARITASVNEAVSGVRTTKALAREEDNLEEFQVESTDMYSHAMRNALQSAVYLPLVITFGSVGVGLALWQGGLAVETGFTLGTLIAFMQYATLFSMPIQDMATQFTQLLAAQAAAERVQGLLETQSEIQDAGKGIKPEIRQISFDAVDFQYKEGEPVLRDCSFEVSAGQTIALVGATGGGKSTIISLLARFYDATGGAILVDGHDLRDVDLSWLQGQFGIVLQDPQLFSGSIADNIRYGRLDATDAEVRAAAVLVHADQFIERMCDGYGTAVGEGGAKLSTGQRQLVSMARAVLAEPKIFVMDEATSSVDTEAERAIQAGLRAVLRGRIAFVIAHRLSTVRDADCILVIEAGQIVERGTHAELLAKGGVYHNLQRYHAVPGRPSSRMEVRGSA